MAESWDVSQRQRDELAGERTQGSVLGALNRQGQATVDVANEVVGTRAAIQPNTEFKEEVAVEGTLVPLPDWGE